MQSVTNGMLYIVEDERAVQRVLVNIATSAGLRATPFDNGEDLLALTAFESPGVILMDMRLPGKSGLDVQTALLERGCDLPVIFLSGHGDVPAVATAMKRGAYDFLEKPFPTKELVSVLLAALSEHSSLQSQAERRRAAQARLGPLSPREQELVPLLIQGWPSKKIATQLGLAKKTIDQHRANVMRKACVGSVAELVRLVVDAGDHRMLDIDTPER